MTKAAGMTRKRVVVAGLGDSGLLTAIQLTRHTDVVGISAKPELVSGQELGMRLTRPDYWAKDYRVAFDRYRRLDRARIVHGTLTGLDLAARAVTVQHADGSTQQEPYDVLIISTGVTNGFWRQPELQSTDEVSAGLRAAHETLAVSRLGDRGRRWRRGREQCRQPGLDVARQAGRPVLSRRARPAHSTTGACGDRCGTA